MNAEPMLADARRAYREARRERPPILEALEERRERATSSRPASLGWAFACSFVAVGTGESAGNGSVLSDADIAASMVERAPMQKSQVDRGY